MLSISRILTLILCSLTPLVSTTGYLLLDLTSSLTTDLRVSANLNLDHIRLIGGSEQSLLIRLPTASREITVEFSMLSASQKITFDIEELETEWVLVFGEVQIQMEAKYHCDSGYSGRFCEHQKLRKFHQKKRVSTTTIPTIPIEVTIFHFNLYFFIASIALPLLIVIFAAYIIYFKCRAKDAKKITVVFIENVV